MLAGRRLWGREIRTFPNFRHRDNAPISTQAKPALTDDANFFCPFFFLFFSLNINDYRSNSGPSSGAHRLIKLTIEYVNGDGFRLSVARVARVFPRVCGLGVLNEEKARRAVALFRHNGDSAPTRVVADYL